VREKRCQKVGVLNNSTPPISVRSQAMPHPDDTGDSDLLAAFPAQAADGSLIG
jgi:hypothetical protein